MSTDQILIDQLEALSRMRPLTDGEVVLLDRAICRENRRLLSTSRNYWTEEDDMKLMTMFRTESTQRMAEVLKRTTAAVSIRITLLRQKGRELPSRRSWDAANAARSANSMARRMGA